MRQYGGITIVKPDLEMFILKYVLRPKSYTRPNLKMLGMYVYPYNRPHSLQLM